MNLTGQQVYQKHEIRRRQKENDREFLAFIRTLKSALSGKGPCEACHYRTAANSGIATKPLFSAIPLTPEEHREQHRIGTFNFMPREWWEEMVEKYYQLWLRHKHG